jgi:beta-phosphoglucomutase-like phosphatase (HAD superfamily)
LPCLQAERKRHAKEVEGLQEKHAKEVEGLQEILEELRQAAAASDAQERQTSMAQQELLNCLNDCCTKRDQVIEEPVLR